MPKWNPSNLARHYRTRLAKNPGCFEDLLGVSSGPMTQSQYEVRSDDTVANAWGEYEGEGWDVQNREYKETRAYYVDDDLVIAITDSGRSEFVTCFHEHFDRPHGVDPGPGVTLGQKRLRYKERLRIDEQGKIIRNLKRIQGLDV